MSRWTGKNCGLHFFAAGDSLPRVEQCPRSDGPQDPHSVMIV